MEHDHLFSTKHGFTGSAMPSKEFRPQVHGFKRGNNMGGGAMGGEMGDEGPIETQPENMKHGGLSHIKGHHKNYAHGGRVEHDSHPKHKHGGYDKDGFEKSMRHGGKVHKKHKED